MAFATLTDKVKRQLGVAMADKSSANDVIDRVNETCTRTTDPLTTSGLGAVAGTGNTVVETVPVIHRTVITLTAFSIAVTDTGGANGAQGSAKVYDFPAGLIHVIGASCDLATLAGAGGIADGAALVGSVGSVAAAVGNATLTSTEADIIPSTAGTLTAGAGTLKGVSTAAVTLNGTQTAADAILNVAVPDADVSANDTLAVTGTITLTWINLGDN